MPKLGNRPGDRRIRRKGKEPKEKNIYRREIIKNLEREANDRFGVQPIYSTRAVLSMNEYQTAELYDSLVHIGNHQFSCRKTNSTPPIQKLATNAAAWNAFQDLSKMGWKLQGMKRKRKPGEKAEVDGTVYLPPDAKKTPEGWWSLKNMGGNEFFYDFVNYVSADVLATMFRNLVQVVSQRCGHNCRYRYKTRLCREGGVTGYISQLEMNGQTFASIGLMVDENQAMQSASEVCLRTLSFLPNIKPDELIIQPYQGGLSFHHKDLKVDKQHIFTDTVYTDFLEAFLESRSIPLAKYFVSGSPEDENKPESTKYAIKVITSNTSNAGTAGSMYLMLYGSNGEAEGVLEGISDNNTKAFKKGQTDNFSVLMVNLGTIHKIRIRQKECKKMWHLKKIIITDVNAKKDYVFDWDAWLFQEKIREQLINANANDNKSEEKLPPVYSLNGEVEKVVDCMLLIGGKVFRSPQPLITQHAKQFAAREALEYFGMNRIQERMELRKSLHVNRYEFWNRTKTVYGCRPSNVKGWIGCRYFPPANYGDGDVSMLLNSKVLVNNLPDSEYTQELVRKEMIGFPRFNNKLFSEMDDICVGEVDANDPDVFIIGNSQFSIKLFCKCGMIYSTQRKAMVEVLPGHNIQKLKCKYQVSIPSLEIHVKAIECYDLYYSNPPLPVVTSCGVVVLCHDREASTDDIFVLVRRRLNGKSFESKMQTFHTLLHKLIQPNAKADITAAECTEGIEHWTYNEVKVLSEMKMEPLCVLMSTMLQYDTRWNELFAKTVLPKPLPEIQAACLNELKRREDAGLSQDDELEWELPQSQFRNSFDSIGINIESSILCGIRSLAETGGLRIHLGDIETAAKTDIPVDKDNKLHRGDVTRFYIWNEQIFETPQINKWEKRKGDAIEICKTEGYISLKPKFEHGSRRHYYGGGLRDKDFDLGTLTKTKKERDNSFLLHMLKNIKYLNEDGTRTDFIDRIGTRLIQNWQKIGKLEATDKEYPKPEDETECEEMYPKDVKVKTEGKSEGENEVKPCEEKTEEKCNEKTTDLPKIPLLGDADFVSSTSSLLEFCRIKNLGRPSYRKQKKKSAEGKVIGFFGTVMFGNHFFRTNEITEDRELVSLHSAEVALRGLGYLKPLPTAAKKRTEINLPGDAKFNSFKGSLQDLGYRDHGVNPKYSVKQEGDSYRAAVVVGKTHHITKDVYANAKEATLRAAYEVLQLLGYLDGIPFEAGYVRTYPKNPKTPENIERELESVVEEAAEAIEANTVQENEKCHEAAGQPMEEVDEANCSQVEEQPKEDIAEGNNAEQPIEEVEEAPKERNEGAEAIADLMDDAGRSLDEQGGEYGEDKPCHEEEAEELHFAGGGEEREEGDEYYNEVGEHIDEQDEELEFADEQGDPIEEEVEECEETNEADEETSEVVESASEDNADEPGECGEEVGGSTAYKNLTANQWAADDDINLGEGEDVVDATDDDVDGAPSAPRVNQWLEEGDICTDDMDFQKSDFETFVNPKTGKTITRKQQKYTTWKERQARAGVGLEIVELEHFVEEDDIERNWEIAQPISRYEALLKRKRKESWSLPQPIKKVKVGLTESPQTSAPKPKRRNLWKDRLPPNTEMGNWEEMGNYKVLQRWERVQPLPARDAYREHCRWMTLEEAIQVCPMLKQVAQTEQFKQQLKKSITEANNFLKSKGLPETAKSKLAT